MQSSNGGKQMKTEATLKLTIESENIHVTENNTSIIFDEGFDTTCIKSFHIDKKAIYS